MNANNVTAATNRLISQQSLDFMQNANAKEGVEYHWTWEYARELWAYHNSVFATLDDKAEDIVKYLGGGTGLFVLGVLAKVDINNYYLAWWSLPAVVLALVAVLLALWSKKVGPFPNLPTVQNAVAYAEDKKNAREATAAFLGQWNLACEGAKAVCDRKAILVERGAYLVYAAMFSLLLPLVVAAYWPPPH
jgi:hypothetical protein